MSTAAQIAANQTNSQLSTGPVTDAGRTRSSLNAVKTGLTGRTVLLPGDDAEQYTRLVTGLFHEHQPVGEEENALVQSIADTNWRLFRIPGLETAIYILGQMELKDAFPQEPDPDVRRHLIQAKTFLQYQRQLNNLSIQEGRLRRQEEKDRKRLKELQEIRLKETRSRLTTAAKEYLNAVASGKQAEFIAKTNEIGFEFSLQSIQAMAETLTANTAQNRAAFRSNAA